MKPWTKASLIVLGLAALPLLAWTATFLYWHIGIRRSITIRETRRLVQGREVTDELRDAAQFLMDAGSRSTPYLVAELDTSKHPEFLNCASYIILNQSMRCDGEKADYSSRFIGWSIVPDDSPDSRHRKMEAMRTWWKEHRSKHPWWRVWLSTCQ